MEVLIVGLVAIVLGFFLGSNLGAKAVASELGEVSNTQAIDRANLLQTLRRELANVLIYRDPQRYLNLYRQLCSDVNLLSSWRTEQVQRRLAELCKEYPSYSDFDSIGTREYVLYSEGISWLSYAELECRYRDMVMFAALSIIADPAWKEATKRGFVHTPNDEEHVHLTKYVQCIEDTKLQLRMERAMNAYYARGDEMDGILENDHFSVRRLQHFAEVRYGIHIRESSEFAIYSFFVFDDGRISYGYFRSDSNFEREVKLRPLHEVVEDVNRQSEGA